MSILSAQATHLTTVNESTLRNALDDGGTITFATDATIFLKSTLEVDRDIVIDGSFRNIYLFGNNAVRIFSVKPGVSLKITHLTLRSGLAQGASEVVGHSAPQPGKGGGVFNDGGSVELINCTIDFCLAKGGNLLSTAYDSAGDGMGGAIYNRGSLTMSNTFLNNNIVVGGAALGQAFLSKSTGDALGGAIYNESSAVMTILGGDIARNSAFAGGRGGGGGGNALGGAIYNRNANLRLRGASFRNNRCNGTSQKSSGGAVYNENGPIYVDGSVFFQNLATGGMFSPSAPESCGGAICNVNGQLSVNRSTFISNSVTGGYLLPAPGVTGANAGPSGLARGGAIASSGKSSTLNSTFYANWAMGGAPLIAGAPGGDAEGGALASTTTSSTSPGILLCTFAENKATSGLRGDPAVGSAVFVKGTKLRLGHTILANAPGTAGLLEGSITDLGYNLSEEDLAQLTASSDIIAANAGLSGAPAQYGGGVPTIGLKAGSPAIDGGASSLSVKSDQRGRPRPSGGVWDIGSYESCAPYLIAGKVQGTFVQTRVYYTDTAYVAVGIDNSFAVTNLSEGSYELQAANMANLGWTYWGSYAAGADIGPDVFDYNFTTTKPHGKADNRQFLSEQSASAPVSLSNTSRSNLRLLRLHGPQPVVPTDIASLVGINIGASDDGTLIEDADNASAPGAWLLRFEY